MFAEFSWRESPPPPLYQELSEDQPPHQPDEPQPHPSIPRQQHHQPSSQQQQQQQQQQQEEKQIPHHQPLPGIQRHTTEDRHLEDALKQSQRDADALDAEMAQHHQRLTKLLMQRKLLHQYVPRDGNCFYEAVCVQVGQLTTEMLRQTISEHLLANSDFYQGFTADGSTIEDIISDVNKPGLWNTSTADLIPLATSNTLQCPLRIFSSREEGPFVYEIKPSLPSHSIPTDVTLPDRIYLAHWAMTGREHYDAVIHNNTELEPKGKLGVL